MWADIWISLVLSEDSRHSGRGQTLNLFTHECIREGDIVFTFSAYNITPDEVLSTTNVQYGDDILEIVDDGINPADIFDADTFEWRITAGKRIKA